MSADIEFLDDARENISFSDDHETIAFGRDPAKCQVVFPAEDTRVGREHFAIERRLGRYRLCLNSKNLVSVDGELAADGLELPPSVVLQLGDKGPRLRLTTLSNAELAATIEGAGPARAAGATTMAREARSGARRNLVLIALCAVLLVVGGVYVSGQQKSRALQLEDWARQVKTQRDSLELALNAMAQDNKDKLAELQSTLGEKFDNAMQAERAQRKALVQKLERSVYMVLAVDPDDPGRETGIGTAWVLNESTLVTNAHVARAPDEIAKITDVTEPIYGMTELRVRSPEEVPRTSRVLGVKVHAGYDAFAELMTARARVSRLADAPLVHGCDVALLFVERGIPLAEPLPLASSEQLAELEVGSTIGYGGYPLTDEVTDLKRPVPTIHLGILSGQSDVFLGWSSPANSTILSVTVPAMKGASGSPILDEDGRVVAVLSAGNLVEIRPNEFVPSGVGTVRCQRSDLVSELLDSEEALARAVEQRQKSWLELLDQRFPEQDPREAQRDALLADLQARHPNLTPTLLHSEEVSLTPAAPVWSYMALWKPGVYIVMALSRQQDDIDLLATGKGLQLQDSAPDWYPVIAFELKSELQLKIDIVCARLAMPSDVGFYVYYSSP